MSNNRYMYCTLDTNFVPESIRMLCDTDKCVKAFSDLPNRVLADLQFLPGIHEQKELIEGVRKIYHLTEQWLLVDQHQIKLQPQVSTDAKHFQSHAELSVALYRLCEEAYRYPGWAKEFFGSPAGVWLSCEYERCLLGFENSGLIGEPLLMSKREFAANMAEFWGKQSRGDSRFNNVPIKFWTILLDVDCLAGILFLPDQEETTGRLRAHDKNLQDIYLKHEPNTPTKLVPPFYMLILTASYLAKEDRKFREGIYQDYIKADKRHARAILNNPNLHGVYITPTGDLIDTQSTANLPGSRGKRKKNDFGK